ncbi:uncharacterized protein LOC126750734 [Anthonomus grandis grandis]|uniref:uncharacterized protein LOC126750734 n=1 Tax=Anthonomus grandis grandis TaxID=2921223 RepID=UPI0021652ED4|nr:uncharacterized protein LOC126750734 [Anthonomus grandis grandis]
MFVKLAVFVCFAGTALAQYQGPLAGGQPASLFPAGVSPQSCPNYPDCSNPLVAISQNGPAPPQYSQQSQQYQQPQYQPQPQYQQQYQPAAPVTPAPVSQYNPVYPQQYAPTSAQRQYAPEVQQRLDRGEYIGDGDYHGEGLAEALAPGFAGQQQAAAPQYQQQARAYQPQQQFNAAPSYSAASPHAQPAQIPAGVNAQACPNYPFCHA